jgi:hypothetical protein
MFVCIAYSEDRINVILNYPLYTDLRQSMFTEDFYHNDIIYCILCQIKKKI